MEYLELLREFRTVLRTEDAPPGFASLRNYLLGRGPVLLQLLDRVEPTLSATPTPLADAELAELVVLEQQATRAPWRVEEFNEPAGNYAGAPMLPTDYLLVIDDGGEIFDVEPTKENQYLKVAMRNALPGLLARLAAAEALLTQAGQAMAGSYDVTEWPADGSTSQDATLKAIREYQTVKGGQQDV